MTLEKNILKNINFSDSDTQQLPCNLQGNILSNILYKFKWTIKKLFKKNKKSRSVLHAGIFTNKKIELIHMN